MKILLDFIQQQQFDRLGVFMYSHEEDTRAYRMYKDQLSEAEKENRANLVIQTQRKISLAKNQAKIGSIQQVLLDREGNNRYIGRTQADSPEVDNEVIIASKKQPLEIGTFVEVKITQAEAYELYASL